MEVYIDSPKFKRKIANKLLKHFFLKVVVELILSESTKPAKIKSLAKNILIIQ